MKRFWLLFLLLSTLHVAAAAKPRVSLREQSGQTILEVRLDDGSYWEESVPGGGANPRALATDDMVAVVVDGFPGCQLLTFDLEGKSLGEAAFPEISWDQAWSDGSEIVVLERQALFSLYQLLPSAGCDLWAYKRGDEKARPVDITRAPELLAEAPEDIVLSWYARNALTPPSDFQPEHPGELWSLGLRASRGDGRARDSLVQRLMDADDRHLFEVAQALALSGADVLKPALMRKAHRLSSREGTSSWSRAMQALRHDFPHLELGQLPGKALRNLPSRAAWENREQLLDMATAGNEDASVALCDALGSWSQEMPARLLATPSFPSDELLRMLGVLDPFPGTVPLLIDRLEHEPGEPLFEALRTQSGVELPSDADLWRAWWACQRGEQPEQDTPAYAWLMHALARQGRLDPATLARHPRLLARLSLPIPCQLSPDGKALVPFACLRGAFRCTAYDLEGAHLEGYQLEKAPAWGAFLVDDPISGKQVEFVADGEQVDMPLEAVEKARDFQSPMLTRWLPNRDSSVLLSGSGEVACEPPQALDPVDARTLSSKADGAHLVDLQKQTEQILQVQGWGRFLPGGMILFSNGQDGQLWEGRQIRRLKLGKDEYVQDSSDKLLVTTERSSLRVRDLRTSRILATRSLAHLLNYRLTPDDRLVIGYGQNLELISLERNEMRPLPDLLASSTLLLASLDASGQRLALCDGQGNLCLWDLKPKPESWEGPAEQAVECWTGTRWVDGKIEPLDMAR